MPQWLHWDRVKLWHTTRQLSVHPLADITFGVITMAKYKDSDMFFMSAYDNMPIHSLLQCRLVAAIWCSSLALSSAQDSSKRNSLLAQVGSLFSWGSKIFKKKWFVQTDIPEILVPRTNFSATPKFSWHDHQIQAKWLYQQIHLINQQHSEYTKNHKETEE